ncbi:hypothetical protein PVAND_001175 [Polypedilum vanderplanki]|uniref:RING-type domain-containing protein n=1 Tax=Polypedilum vanderplanki TaxID=319348 RepID=A0A9J6BME9_POLVA|nr:hypothetical protein PVAND_001175 [Polypedilum vanderplanki]
MNNEDNSQNITVNPSVIALHCYECDRSWLQKGNQMSCIACQSEFVEILTTGHHSSFGGIIHNRLKRRHEEPSQQNQLQNEMPSTSRVRQQAVEEPRATTNDAISNVRRELFNTPRSHLPIQLNEIQSRSTQVTSNATVTQSAISQQRVNIALSSAVPQMRVNIHPIDIRLHLPLSSMNTLNDNINLSNRNSGLPTSTSYENITKRAKFLTKSDMKKIPRITIKDLSENDSECVICCEEFKRNYVIRQLECNHVFHQKCLFPWLEKDGTCPICRYDLIEAKKKAINTIDVQ